MAPPAPEISRWTLHSFATLVKKLRTVQKASGIGYKTLAAGTSAKPLEQQVDAAILWVSKHWFPLDQEPIATEKLGITLDESGNPLDSNGKPLLRQNSPFLEAQ